MVTLNRIGGSEFVAKMIGLFLEEAPQRIAAARAGEQSRRFEDIAAAAHSLKSSAHTLGASKLSRLAEKLEQLAGREQMDAIPALLREVEESFSAAKAWLETQR
ncbi:MAG TPA: Hpt domain-containing protein [Chthoniobacteraceae bacterium]|nr:Hpt domain-containing protein [Chthoniobacteraceae bacterium]